METGTLFRIEDSRLAKRRLNRRLHIVVDCGILIVAGALAVVATVAPSLLDVRNPGLLSIAVILLFAIGSYAFWSDNRTLKAINPVEINTSGLSPPFKPKWRLMKNDWFVSYKDIVSMTPVAETAGFVPAYNITLRDGGSFQLNALDLLVYVEEKEVRRYAKILTAVKEIIERPENRARAAKGEDLVIPKDRFDVSRD